MFRSSKLILFVMCAWLAGWSGITIGGIHDEQHRLKHQVTAVTDHSHGDHRGSHSHDQGDPKHVPLPFDSFVGLTPAVSSVSGVAQGISHPVSVEIIYAGAELLVHTKSVSSISPQGPPVPVDDSCFPSFSNLAPPLLA